MVNQLNTINNSVIKHSWNCTWIPVFAAVNCMVRSWLETKPLRTGWDFCLFGDFTGSLGTLKNVSFIRGILYMDLLVLLPSHFTNGDWKDVGLFFLTDILTKSLGLCPTYRNDLSLMLSVFMISYSMFGSLIPNVTQPLEEVTSCMTPIFHALAFPQPFPW